MSSEEKPPTPPVQGGEAQDEAGVVVEAGSVEGGAEGDAAAELKDAGGANDLAIEGNDGGGTKSGGIMPNVSSTRSLHREDDPVGAASNEQFLPDDDTVVTGASPELGNRQDEAVVANNVEAPTEAAQEEGQQAESEGAEAAGSTVERQPSFKPERQPSFKEDQQTLQRQTSLKAERQESFKPERQPSFKEDQQTLQRQTSLKAERQESFKPERQPSFKEDQQTLQRQTSLKAERQESFKPERQPSFKEVEQTLQRQSSVKVERQKTFKEEQELTHQASFRPEQAANEQKFAMSRQSELEMRIEEVMARQRLLEEDRDNLEVQIQELRIKADMEAQARQAAEAAREAAEEELRYRSRVQGQTDSRTQKLIDSLQMTVDDLQAQLSDVQSQEGLVVELRERIEKSERDMRDKANQFAQVKAELERRLAQQQALLVKNRSYLEGVGRRKMITSNALQSAVAELRGKRRETEELSNGLEGLLRRMDQFVSEEAARIKGLTDIKDSMTGLRVGESASVATLEDLEVQLRQERDGSMLDYQSQRRLEDELIMHMNHQPHVGPMDVYGGLMRAGGMGFMDGGDPSGVVMGGGGMMNGNMMGMGGGMPMGMGMGGGWGNVGMHGGGGGSFDNLQLSPVPGGAHLNMSAAYAPGAIQQFVPAPSYVPGGSPVRASITKFPPIEDPSAQATDKKQVGGGPRERRIAKQGAPPAGREETRVSPPPGKQPPTRIPKPAARGEAGRGKNANAALAPAVGAGAGAGAGAGRKAGR